MAKSVNKLDWMGKTLEMGNVYNQYTFISHDKALPFGVAAVYRSCAIHNLVAEDILELQVQIWGSQLQYGYRNSNMFTFIK